MPEFQHPHTIENGAGEQLTFERIEESDDGKQRLIVSNVVQPGSGPPMHVHFKQRESLTVVSGRMGYQLEGQSPKSAGPGESATFEPGVAHKFWAEGDDPLECTGFVEPPHNVEYFLSEIFRSTRENNGERPDDFDAAFLMHRYRTEFDMLEIPSFVKTVVFPVLRTLGNITGKFQRYKDSPTPA